MERVRHRASAMETMSTITTATVPSAGFTFKANRFTVSVCITSFYSSYTL